MLNVVSIFFFVTVTWAVSDSDTKISTTRNQFRDAVCTYYSSNFTDQQVARTTPIIQAYNYLTDEQIQDIIFYGNYTYFPTETILLCLPHIVSLIVLILIWPGLCCCCCRPDKFPVCKRCRKDPQQMYGRCQLKWPSYLLLVAFLAVLVGSSVGVIQGPNISNQINNVGCQMMAIADDTYNGRVSPSDQTVFFVGLGPFKSQLENLKSKISTFYSQSNSSLNSSESIRVKQNNIQLQISNQYSSYNNIVYSGAFTQTDGATYVPINSDFKTMYYGPVTDSATILGNINSQLASIFKEINKALDPMIEAWNNIQPLGTSTLTSQMTETINKISSYQTSINNTINQFAFYTNQQLFNGVNIGFKLFYGFIIGLSALGTIATLLLAICSVVRARMLIYFTCSFLMFIGILSFVLTIITASALPTLSQICAYMDRQLADPQTTESFLKNLKFNDNAILYKNCINGSGNMLPELSPSFNTSFLSMKLLAKYTQQFNDLIPNFSTQNLQSPFNQATSTISLVNTSKVLDVNSSISDQFLQALSRKSFALDASCTGSSNVAADSWVPSTDIISCQGGTFQQESCLDLSDLAVCPQGCYQIFQQLTSPSGDPTNYNANLNTRYGSGCNYASYIINLHDNWNIPRMAEMQSVQNDLDTIKALVDNYDLSVKSIQASLSTFKSNLQANFNSQYNLTSGSFYGFDCRVIGETINQFRNSACAGLLYSVQYNYVFIMIISYGILFISCFSVCGGVRHYQHLQRMSASVDYKGVPIAVSSKRIHDETFE